jgi:hypothetical protein
MSFSTYRVAFKRLIAWDDIWQAVKNTLSATFTCLRESIAGKSQPLRKTSILARQRKVRKGLDESQFPSKVSPMKTIYLNRDGSKWRNVGETITFRTDFYSKPRTQKVAYWEAMSNFPVPFVRVAGKTVLLMKDFSDNWIVNNDANRAEKYAKKGWTVGKSVVS